MFLSGNDSRFFTRLTQDFADVADSLGYRRLTLHRTLVAESAPEKLAKNLIRSSKKRHALIVFGNEHPLVYEALRQCREANVPVITLVTDLPDAQRLCHVGIDQQQAGRTAGRMMGLMAHRPGEVLMLSGRQDFSAHRLRIQGFREVISQRFPHLQLGEVLAGGGQPAANRPPCWKRPCAATATWWASTIPAGQHAGGAGAGSPPPLRRVLLDDP